MTGYNGLAKEIEHKLKNGKFQPVSTVQNSNNAYQKVNFKCPCCGSKNYYPDDKLIQMGLKGFVCAGCK